jgi:phenylacetate-coenzyme A ligase PaaK-like adenylate-forming protein
MVTQDEVFASGNSAHIWQKYCGFLDLSTEQFMRLQAGLLLEQIDQIAASPLARKLMPSRPRTVEEFRRLTPLTTYADYAPDLSARNESALAVKPASWVCTSGRGGSIKWIPWTETAMEIFAEAGIAAGILACANQKGEVRVRSGMRALANLASPPYGSGLLCQVMIEKMGVTLMPPFAGTETLEFAARTQLGFKMGLRNGVDLLSSLTSVLIKMGENFSQSSGQMKLSRGLLHPRILGRLVAAWVNCKIQRRSLLPRDLWPIKGLIAYGMDTDLYREQLRHYWGREPLEIYAATESGTIATQAWNKKGLTFIPYTSFYEFIPEEEWLQNRQNPRYQPSTVLLNQVQPGKRYEIVITSYYGMPFLRYRIGDLIRITSLEDKAAGIHLPQMVFVSRADDLIDLAGFTRLDEKTLGAALLQTGFRYEDWTARKESANGKNRLKLYIEPKGNTTNTVIWEEQLHQALSAISEDYRDLSRMLEYQPLEVRLLPEGSFQRYYKDRQQAGADLAHLKPPHMNASDLMINKLLPN